MTDDVKNLIAVLNSLANVHGSIADSKLATERYKQSLKDNKEMKLLSAELTNKNSQNVFMRNQLDKALTNSISDITKTHNKIQGLGIDYQNYITEADVSEIAAYLYNNSGKGAGGNTAGRGILAVTNNASSKVSFNADL